MSDAPLPPHVQARIDAINDALARRTEKLRQDPDYVPGQPRKPKRRMPSFKRGTPLYPPEEPLPTEELWRPPLAGREASQEELAFRDTLAELLLAMEDWPDVTTDPVVGGLLEDGWAHLTHKQTMGDIDYSLCFDGPLRQDLLARLRMWLLEFFPSLLEPYAALWTPREHQNLTDLIKPPPPKTPLPPTQQDLF